jgi:hypothetical protein
MLLRTLLLTTVLLLGATGPAAAGDRHRPRWGKGSSWDVHIDPDADNPCYAVRGFFGGTGILIAVRSDGGLAFAIARNVWQFPEAGKTYRLKFVFGNDRTYEEEFEAVAIGSGVALWKSRMSAAFLSDFRAKTNLHVYHQGSLISSVLLLDADQAVAQLRTCNASLPGMIDPTNPAFR